MSPRSISSDLGFIDAANQREQHLYIVRTWRNAPYYADEFGCSVERFRKAVADHYGFTVAWATQNLTDK